MSGYIDAPIRCTMEFDEVDQNGLPLKYTIYYGIEPEINVDESGAYIPNEEENYATLIKVKEGESDDTGNAIGVMSYNTAHIELVDSFNRLNPTNQFSPYYGLMRYGVRLYFEISYDNCETWEPYGEYYTTDWTAGLSDDKTYITGCDKLQYITNIDIPKLPAYSGISIQELLVNLMIEVDRITYKNTTSAVLKGDRIPEDNLGKSGDYFIHSDEVGVYRKIDSAWKLIFYIDKRLNIDMKYGITIGSKLKETLNSFSKALNAKVIIDRSGAVRFIPSNETYGKVYEMRAENFTGNGGSAMYNSANIYNGIELNFNETGDGADGSLLTMDGQKLKVGTNTIYGIRFNKKTLTMEDLYIDTDDEVDGHVVDIDVEWHGYQDGADIVITNNTGVEVPYSLYLDGVYINTIKSTVRTNIDGTDTKVPNNLVIYSDVVQTEEEAIKAANATALRLEKSSKKLILITTMSEKVTSGDIILGMTGNQEYDKVFKVISSDTLHGIGYTKTLEVEDTGGIVNWSDIDTWNDNDDIGIWIESMSYELPEEPEEPEEPIETLYWTDIGIWLDAHEDGIWKETSSTIQSMFRWNDYGVWLDSDETGLWLDVYKQTA